MRKSIVLAAVAVAGLLAAAPIADAKTFQRGDLRLCDARRCIAVQHQAALDALSSLYYGSRPPTIAAALRLGSRFLRLEFRNRYVTGVVGSKAFDRFLSYSVNLSRLHAGTWYHLPSVAAAELRAIGTELRPLRLTRAAIARSR